MADNDPILTTWSFSTENPHTTIVMPDGCRDLIIRQRPDGTQHVFFSHLMHSPETVSVLPGETFFGVRLKAGAAIAAHILSKAPTPNSLSTLAALAREAASISSDSTEMLACLAVATSSASAAHALGVSLRTLQRHAVQITGESPDFWRQLARARKAARGILSGHHLQDAVAGYLFSDQAHMTRDLKRWFGFTPGALASGRNNPSHPAWSLCDAGYDAPPTGEQISIR